MSKPLNASLQCPLFWVEMWQWTSWKKVIEYERKKVEKDGLLKAGEHMTWMGQNTVNITLCETPVKAWHAAKIGPLNKCFFYFFHF